MISLVVLTVFVFKRHLLVRARPGLAALMGTCAALHMLVVGEPHSLAWAVPALYMANTGSCWLAAT